MKLKRESIILLVLLLLLCGVGCGGGQKSGEKTREQEKEMPKAFMEIHSGALAIVQQADLLPAVNRLKGQAQTKDSGAGKEGDKGGTKVGDLTYEDTLLGELLKAEGFDTGNEELPSDAEMIWDNIGRTIMGLHSRWNELQPQIMRENIPAEDINTFEGELDSLTLFSNERNYFATMDSANRLTGSLAGLMPPFADKKVLPAYELSFHLRNIVLRAAADDYAKAQESLDYILRRAPALEESLDKKKFRALESSLGDLQRVVQKQNLNLIILNSAVAMKNIAGVEKEGAA
ncbi:MAG TPA: hypothetical protein GXZ24_01970 [Firmicutes bacterium]|nr:hypothetical protein [Bacillota bacterium]